MNIQSVGKKNEREAILLSLTWNAMRDINSYQETN